MARQRQWQVVINTVTLVFTVVLNTLANVRPLNGRTTGEISYSFNLLFTLAGYRTDSGVSGARALVRG